MCIVLHINSFETCAKLLNLLGNFWGEFGLHLAVDLGTKTIRLDLWNCGGFLENLVGGAIPNEESIGGSGDDHGIVDGEQSG
jgi:hypothetical protein